jgi:hypothetical protein
LGGFRDSVFLADQREPGVPRFLDEPIPAASSGDAGIAHRNGKSIFLESPEKARLRSVLLLRTSRRGNLRESALARKQ